jgi:intracellular septation protein
LKILLDFLPLALFFASYQYGTSHREWAAAFASAQFGFLVSGGPIGTDEAPMLLATVVVMLATLAQVLILKLMRQKVDAILWVSLGLVMVLGFATLYFHSKTFIMWKPTALYWVMALGFWAAERFWGKNPLKAMLKDVPLPEPVWRTMNLMWVGFFAFMGVLNLAVAYGFSEATWASFKAFGSTALMFLFVIAQGFYMNKHLPPLDEQASAKTDTQP